MHNHKLKININFNTNLIDEIVKTTVLKTEPDRLVRPIEPRTGDWFDPARLTL